MTDDGRYGQRVGTELVKWLFTYLPFYLANQIHILYLRGIMARRIHSFLGILFDQTVSCGTRQLKP